MPHSSFFIIFFAFLLFLDLQFFFGCHTYHFTTFVPCSSLPGHLCLSTAHLFPCDSPPSLLFFFVHRTVMGISHHLPLHEGLQETR